MELPDWVIVCGLLLGSVAVISAAWVWVRHRVFGSGGSVLSVVGVILIGLSIWKNVEVRAGADGIEWKFEQLQSRIAETESRVAEAESKAAEAVEQGRLAVRNAELARDNLIHLTDELRSQAVLEPGQIDELRNRIREQELPRNEGQLRN